MGKLMGPGLLRRVGIIEKFVSRERAGGEEAGDGAATHRYVHLLTERPHLAK